MVIGRSLSVQFTAHLFTVPGEIQMLKSALRSISVCLLVSCTAWAANTVPTPSEFLKIQVGADRTLADYHQIQSYFEMLAKSSPRVRVEKLGKTTLDNDLVMAVITSEEN